MYPSTSSPVFSYLLECTLCTAYDNARLVRQHILTHMFMYFSDDQWASTTYTVVINYNHQKYYGSYFKR